MTRVWTSPGRGGVSFFGFTLDSEWSSSRRGAAEDGNGEGHGKGWKRVGLDRNGAGVGAWRLQRDHGRINPSGHVAEVETDAGAQASNAGNIASLTDVIERNPRDAEAYNTRGVVYAKLGRYSNAIDDFSHAIELNPHFSGAYTNRALAYRQEKRDDLALQDFNQAIAANPSDAAAYLGRGNLLRSQNDFNGALADLNQAIRLNPEGAQAYHARGLIYQRQGNDVQAITDFNNAIDRDPFAGAPYQARGQSLMATGKYEAAIEDFNAALNVDANNSDAWAGLGFCYEKLNNRAKAIEFRTSARSRSIRKTAAPAALQRLS